MKISSNWSGMGLIVLAIITLVGCKAEGDHPGYTYMPDMAFSRAYKSYSENPNFDDGKSARLPVTGTIPRGLLPDDVESTDAYLYTAHYPNTTENYDSAGDRLTNPLPASEEVLAEGARMYKIYCAVCHGAKGTGDGHMVTTEQYPAVPPDFTATPKLVDMKDGQMFHSVTYGFNMMGSYASQLTPTERWMVIHYVNKLQGDYDEAAAPAEEADEESAMAEDAEEGMKEEVEDAMEEAAEAAEEVSEESEG